jgi:hypothetical protein
LLWIFFDAEHPVKLIAAFDCRQGDVAIERVDSVIGKWPRHLVVELLYYLPLGEEGLYLDGVGEL